jgi:hypothetical protein
MVLSHHGINPRMRSSDHLTMMTRSTNQITLKLDQGIAYNRATKAERLSRQHVWVASVLIDLGLPPIGDIPRFLKTTQDALPVVALVLKCLQEVLDSGAGPWD